MHEPVLEKELLKYLSPGPNENFIDCTLDGGGHTALILEKNGPEGKVLGIEWDRELIRTVKADKRLILVNDSYVHLEEIVEKNNFGPVSGILFDLGLSAWHLEESGRGFSFQRNEPLDMRYDAKIQFQNGNGLTVREIVNKFSIIAIEKVLKEYGEEIFAKRIAQKIIEERKIMPIETTFQLVEIVKKATPDWYHRRRIHFATRAFQALRIAVNDELNNIKRALPQALKVLAPAGRIAVISFHSLEDGIVKNFFRDNSKQGHLKILTKKPVRPSYKEIKLNPRSRSARLRAAVKCDIDICKIP